MFDEQSLNWRSVAARVGVHRTLLIQPSVMLAQLLLTRGEQRAAESACRDLLQQNPNHIECLNWLASVLETECRFDEAERLRRRAFEAQARACGFATEGTDEITAFRLAACGYGKEPGQAPAAYVSSFFDSYAGSYDRHVRGCLDCHAPELVCAALTRALGGVRPGLHILDAGCGTGLAAPLLRPLALRLEGIDLSSGMLDRARATGLYDSLERADFAERLKARRGYYDIICAIDVLVYFGFMTPVMAAAAFALRQDGLFAFSVEAGGNMDYELRGTGRYVHSGGYLRKAAEAAGLVEVSVESATLRLENQQPVQGMICVLRNGAGQGACAE